MLASGSVVKSSHGTHSNKILMVHHVNAYTWFGYLCYHSLLCIQICFIIDYVCEVGDIKCSMCWSLTSVSEWELHWKVSSKDWKGLGIITCKKSSFTQVI